MDPIAFINLAAQQSKIQPQLQLGIEQVLQHGQYILGPEVAELEHQLSEYTQAAYTISCANGTDALSLLLMAKNIGPNDAVLVPSFTYAATAEVVAYSGAVPIFVDVMEDTFTISISSLKDGIAHCQQLGLTPRGIIAVDLFGLCADYSAINALAAEHGLWVIADAAQSFGAKINNESIGTLCEMTTTSFFPAKPLGCYGDGGAIFLKSDDQALMQKLRSLRAHGTGASRYDHIHIGINSRLDTLQAAILLEKLKIFDEEYKQRVKIAEFYTQHLQSIVRTPVVPQGYTHAWALYSICCNPNHRPALLEAFKQHEIPYMVYYEKPLHLQGAYSHFPQAPSGLATTEKLSQEIVSIPMHPYLSDKQLQFIVEVIQNTLR